MKSINIYNALNDKEADKDKNNVSNALGKLSKRATGNLSSDGVWSNRT